MRHIFPKILSESHLWARWSGKVWEEISPLSGESLSLEEVHDFIQYFIDYLEKKGYSEPDIIGVVRTLDMLSQFSAREKLAFCHRMLDCYADNITPYIYTQQVIGLDNLAKKLAAESVCSTVNAAIHCGELAEALKMGMELGEIDGVSDLYGDLICKFSKLIRESTALEVRY